MSAILVANKDCTKTSKTSRTRPKAKRSYHKKVKTGCITCKIRRVRCDEEKPSCTRCTSTGRKCDGYAPPEPPSADVSSTSSSDTPCADLQLLSLKRDILEVRSFHYFLEVTAPSIAGSFDSTFWMDEIPRICRADPAIWHAIVSLGSVYEQYSAPVVLKGGCEDGKNAFALRQFNSSIQCMTKPGSLRKEDRWKALVVSIIFTCVCVLEGLHEQSLMHFRSGFNLLKEMDSEREDTPETELVASSSPPKPQKLSTKDRQLQPRPSPSSVPISMASIRSIMVGFEMREKAIYNSGVFEMPTLLSSTDNFSLWQSYAAPAVPAHCLTAANLTLANRAAESLMSGFLLFAQQHVAEFGRLHGNEGGPELADKLAAGQLPLLRCYRELERALLMFKQASDLDAEGQGKAKKDRAQLRRSFLFLKLYLIANKIFLVRDPDEVDGPVRSGPSKAACTAIVEVAEQILQVENDIREHGGTLTLPTPPISIPLMTVAHTGCPWSVRRRAAQLLRQPRIEGLLDCSLSASLSEAMMAREEDAAEEYRQEMLAEGSSPESLVSGNEWCEEDEMEVPPMARIYNTSFTFTGRREAVVVMRTWHELEKGRTGYATLLEW